MACEIVPEILAGFGGNSEVISKQDLARVFKNMTIYTKDNELSYFATEWELTTMEEWDKLSEGQRGFVSHNGKWEMAKKIRETVPVSNIAKKLK